MKREVQYRFYIWPRCQKHPQGRVLILLGGVKLFVEKKFCVSCRKKTGCRDVRFWFENALICTIIQKNIILIHIFLCLDAKPKNKIIRKKIYGVNQDVKFWVFQNFGGFCWNVPLVVWVSVFLSKCSL